MLKRKHFFLIGLFLTILLAAYSLTSACGGFFCSNVSIDQSAERIIFTVNGDNTITAIVGINYTGEAEDFSWVVPVPSPPEVDVTETASLDVLQTATNRSIRPPTNYCFGVLGQNILGMGGGFDDYLSLGTAGPYDYAIIRNENPNELVAWLRQNGYTVTDDMIPIIGRYVHEGLYFLAMRLSQDSDVGDIQPVVMTYESDHPMIPIRLTAVAAVPNMPILTWIFADTQYVPENYALVTPDYSQFRTGSQILTVGGFGSPPMSLYGAELTRIQQQYNGLAFVTEYAQPTVNLIGDPLADPLIADLIERFPYVTRLRAQMSPEQMTLDPNFIADPDAPDVSSIVELNDYVEPLDYWGCSTRSIRDLPAEELLPAYTYVEEFDAHVGHPEGWVLSSFDMRDDLPEDPPPLYALAPEPVDASDIDAFFAGESTMPIFIMMDTVQNSLSCQECALQPTRVGLYGLGQTADTPIPEGLALVQSLRYAVPTTVGSYALPGHIFAVLTTAADWEQNSAFYSAMLRYPNSYQYYNSPTLRHTLFFGNFRDITSDMPRIVLSFPEGWTERIVNDLPLITQDGLGDAAPSVRLRTMREFGDTTQGNFFYQDFVLENVADAYGLDAGALLDFYHEAQASPCSEPDFEPVMFNMDGRQGFMRIDVDYVVEASAPEADFEALSDTLFQIVGSSRVLGACG